MELVNLDENVNLSEQVSITNMIMCNKCKREVEKINTKRVFGQKKCI